MNFLRRIFGGSSREWDTGSSRRIPHVTPSSNHRSAPDGSENDAPPEPPADSTDPAPAPPVSIEAAADAAPPAEPPPAPESKAAQPHREAAAITPPFQPELPPSEPHSPLTYGIASDVGKVRSNNEDACFAMQWRSITVDDKPDFGFFIIADGMGGHLDGEKAASIAVQTLASEMLEKIIVPLLRDFDSSESPTILEALVSASEKANLAVIASVPGGGTTLSTVVIIGNLAYLVHVGDSRAYLIHSSSHSSGIEQLTTDHTLVQRLIEMNEITPEEAENYPQKNILYRAIGQNEKLKVERLIRTLPAGAQILICSDGLWDLVDDDTLRQVALAAPSPQDACNRLVALANERGGIDNISVIVLKIAAPAPAG